MCIIMSLDVNEIELKGLKLKTYDLPEKRHRTLEGHFDSP